MFCTNKIAICSYFQKIVVIFIFSDNYEVHTAFALYCTCCAMTLLSAIGYKMWSNQIRFEKYRE